MLSFDRLPGLRDRRFTPREPAGKIALVNGTLINPATAKVVPNALVIIEGDRISAVGDQATAISTKDAQIIDCKGKFILPGYIDTHVHFFQSGDIYTRPTRSI